MSVGNDHNRPMEGPVALLVDFGFAHWLQSMADAIWHARLKANALADDNPKRAELTAWADAMEVRRAEAMLTGSVFIAGEDPSDG